MIWIYIDFVDPESMKAQALINAQNAVMRQEEKVSFCFSIFGSLPFSYIEEIIYQTLITSYLPGIV